MLFVPYSTDAPVYYYPYGTVGLIVVNVIMFIAFCTGDQLYDSIDIQQFIEEQAHVAEGDGRQEFNDDPANEDSGLRFAEDEEDGQAPVAQEEVPRVADEVVEDQVVEPVVETEHRSFARNMLLDYGEGLKPWQWFTSFFMHAGWMHLIGNMIFLWCFGLVVEGKIGALFFVPLYILIGASECAVEQTLTLFASEGVSLGASSAVFGLMAIVMVWAPFNEFSVLVSYFVSYHVYEFSHFIFGLVYVGLNLLEMYFGGFNTTGGLHMLGFVVGLPVGLFLLNQGYVDCEGYDAISYWHGKYGNESTVGKVQAKTRRKKKAAKQKAREASLPQEPVNLEPFQQQVAEAIDAGDLEIAMKLQNRLAQKYPELTWRQPDLKRLISALVKQKKLDQAFPAMEKYIQLFPSDAFVMQSAMAKIWLQQERPKHTLRFMQKMDLNALNADQRILFKKLVATAKDQIESGVVEY